MGAVYRADDLRLAGRVCAIKEVLPELLLGGAAQEDFKNQALEQFYQEASV
ncbi:MAG: serine/threonine protein kinase, partial [Caldilineae bacterium]